MCLLTILVKNTRPEAVKLAKIAKNSGFSRLLRDRTFERKVIETSEILENDFFSKYELYVRTRTFKRILIETWLYAQMKGIDV